MKYYSEILNKPFDTEKACLEAERNYQDQQSNASKRKRELDKAIQLAQQKVDQANNEYEVAKQKATKLLEESNKQIKEILDNAEKAVKDAEEEKYKAISNFNKEFGTYKVTVTGEKAAEQLNKALKQLETPFTSLLDSFLDLL